ncbi:hypothetical protein AG1IA_02355 [Rhizoctonia solani AG-1 IA]|uniref:Uncharacterized protein n=1 Tax=Thanatephorus cucumeris (strain AG1-IA) TaxID=983506 RepID=L8X3B5_THACA|nr:hypothetical protein AG1IA_02355 [Rhizoctonia solani AG-1 IA]
MPFRSASRSAMFSVDPFTVAPVCLLIARYKFHPHPHPYTGNLDEITFMGPHPTSISSKQCHTH